MHVFPKKGICLCTVLAVKKDMLHTILQLLQPSFIVERTHVQSKGKLGNENLVSNMHPPHKQQPRFGIDSEPTCLYLVYTRKSVPCNRSRALDGWRRSTRPHTQERG